MLVLFQSAPPTFAKDHILKFYLCTISERRALDFMICSCSYLTNNLGAWSCHGQAQECPQQCSLSISSAGVTEEKGKTWLFINSAMRSDMLVNWVVCCSLMHELLDP